MLEYTHNVDFTDEVKEKLTGIDVINSVELLVYDDNGELVATVTKENIGEESLTIKQAISDGDRLRLGGCIASEMTLELINTEDMTFAASSVSGGSVSLLDRNVELVLVQKYPGAPLLPSPTLYPSAELLPGYKMKEVRQTLFYGRVDDFERTDGYNNFIITAYDPIADLFNSDISNAFNKVLSAHKSALIDMLKLCMKGSGVSYRKADFSRVGFVTERKYLRNDDWENNSEKITRGALLRHICELSGGYGYYRPSEKKIRLLAPDDDIRGTERYEVYEAYESTSRLSPRYQGIVFNYAGDIEKDKNNRNNQWGGKVAYFDSDCFDVQGTTVKTEIDVGIYAYDMTDNIILWDYYNTGTGGQTSLSLIRPVFERFHNVMNNLHEASYAPGELTAPFKPWVELGDTIEIVEPVTNLYGEYLDNNGEVTDSYDNAKKEIIKSRVLARTISGIEALTDVLEAKGER